MRVMLAGKKGSGKDAAVNFLIARYGGKSFSFAKPLYDMLYFCQDRLGIPRHKDRLFLTTMGDFFRKDDPDVFIKACFEDVSRSKESNSFIVDGRYENELNAGIVNSFYLVNVLSDDAFRQVRRPTESVADAHSSENGYSLYYKFHYTVHNNGSLEEFHNNLISIIEDIKHKEKLNAS